MVVATEGRVAAVCEGAGVVLVSAVGCSLGMGGAALVGLAWVRVTTGAAGRGKLEVGSRVGGAEHLSWTSGSNGREKNVLFLVYIFCKYEYRT